MNYEIKRLTPELAADYFDFFDNRAFTDRVGAFCYCTWFHYDCSIDEYYKHGKDAMRNCAASFIADGKLKGYLAYVDGISIGWCNADDKSNYRRLETESFFCGNSAERVKAITCFEIAPEYRGKGIATALLERVISDAKDEGYGFVESYPHLHNQHDPFDYAGPIRLYEKAGFAEVARNGDKIVMIKEITVTEETNEERQARIYPIILSEYNFAWPEWYAEEKLNLERLIGIENIARISHFGSTSVPGLTAKPTVDILLEIKEDADTSKLIESLSSPDYICLNPPDMPTPPPHLMFLKGYLPDGFAEKVYHIHVRYHGDWDELYFRDYLIAHPETAAEYAELKVKLHKNLEHDRDGYTYAKTAFIREVTQKAKEDKIHGRNDS
jgi:GrpB-like predicted nucleotidyltransferase (UPF0157 family)/GNAT superfamily N-acetyltransferase